MDLNVNPNFGVENDVIYTNHMRYLHLVLISVALGLDLSLRLISSLLHIWSILPLSQNKTMVFKEENL